MKKPGFSLIEIMIVVTILALASAVGASSWRYALIKGEFDDTVTDIISVFQQARSYSSKNVEIEVEIAEGVFATYYNTIYSVEYDGTSVISMNGNEMDAAGVGPISEVNLTGIVELDGGVWWIDYEVPYSYASTDDGNDIEFTVTSLKGTISKTIIVHNLSGIAETVE